MSLAFATLKRKFSSLLIRLRRFFVSQRFGVSPDQVYGQDFYEGGGFAKTKESADKLAAWLSDRYAPRSVLDIGCGPGEYLRAFAEHGVQALGCDGSSSGVARVPEVAHAFVYDLRKPLVINKRFDLVMCVEVAEHLPRSSSAILIASICANAKDTIVFTAAPPGCPGDDHINCRPMQFWKDFFHMHGFTIDDDATWLLRNYAMDNDLAQWWQEWSFIFKLAHLDTRGYL